MKNLIHRLLAKPRKTHRDLTAIASAVECDELTRMHAGTVAIDVQNRAGRVKISHAISKQVADDLIDELDELAGVKNLSVTISAPIGLGAEALRIHNKLRAVSRSGVHVECIASGDCSGAGTLVFLAGDDRHLEAGSVLAFEYPISFGQGAARDIGAAADRLEAVESATIDAIFSRTNINPVIIIDMMIKASPIAAAEALKLRIATRAPVAAKNISPAVQGAILGFRPPPEPSPKPKPTQTMSAKPTATAKPARPAKPAPCTAYEQYLKISAANPVQGGIFKVRNRDAIIASMPAGAPPIQF